MTELSKAVARMHNDLKVAQQYAMDDGNDTSDAPTKNGSSVLGKYIIGAKNNFRGFTTRQDDKCTDLKVTVHSIEEKLDKEKFEAQMESDIQQNEVDECRDEGQFPDSVVVRMEEGRAQAEQEEKKEINSDEKEKAAKGEISVNKVKEEKKGGNGFTNTEETLSDEATDEEAETLNEGGMNKEGRVPDEHMTSAHAESIEVSDEKIETQKIICKFNHIELQGKKAAQPSWMKGRKPEHNVAETPHNEKSNEKPEMKKMIPSPTGSSSSQDMGFGSQEGEESIDGTPVRP